MAAPGTLPALEAQRVLLNRIQFNRAARALRAPTSLCPHPLRSAPLVRAQARQLGVSFRSQLPVARHFIADFCTPSRKLIIEVDGPVHARKHAVRVLRISAELVRSDLKAALALIRAAL